MNTHLPPYYRLSPEVAQARVGGMPIVALESTVITHGLPYPENIRLAQDMECEVRRQGAIPATTAVLDGLILVGLNQEQLERLAVGKNLHKASPRDFARLLVEKESGGTTVAGTLFVAHAAGIQVLATGGIGGVHHHPPSDISADLPQLARTPLIVVCAGAKAILDLPATLEYLETHGVPVVGYQGDDFPAFYTTSSRLPTSARADTAEEVAALARIHWEMGVRSAVLVTVPPPPEVAISDEDVREAIRQALKEVRDQRLRGQQVTPYLLRRVSELTGGASLRANLGLLRNNARVAGEIARALVRPSSRKL